MTEQSTPVDLGTEVMTCRLLVIGCGNLLRGDDGVGPILIRHLWQGGVPDDVRLVDGGTAGMDVSFQMRGAQRVIIIDACTTGKPPGTIYKIPGPEVEDLPPLSGLHTHMFRWDNALAFGRWLLKEDYPQDVDVYLIEVEDFTPGAALGPAIDRAMREVLELIRAEPAFQDPNRVDVEFTDSGYLRLGAADAARFFPSDVAVALPRDGQLWLLPLHSASSGGLVFKQRTPAGDRCLLVREVLNDELPVGVRSGRWDATEGALRVDLVAGR